MTRPPRVAAVVLAAGRSTRMAGDSKLLAELEGRPVVAHAVDSALASRVCRVVVVTGHEADRVRDALEGRAVDFVHNAEHAAGMSTSLRAGLSALGRETEAALVCLGDMPRVGPGTLDALIDALAAGGERDICVPHHGGRRGNPVLWPARCFAAMRALSGDVGARSLLAAEAQRVCAVEVLDAGIHLDVDTAGDLARLA